jgi:uncharacterized protein YbgA (DUF1722 family)/uncharacterized protein YbbK (DUF523 family)
MEKIKIGVSSCLIGEKVRYDGTHKLDPYITRTLGQYFDFVPVCPEVEYGLSVPRETLRLIGDPASPRLVTTRTGIDHTAGMERWAQGRLDELKREALSGFIFKSRSPSSGLKGVRVYTSSGAATARGSGIFAAAFTRENPLMPVIDEGRLHDPDLRATFLDSVVAYRRWQEFLGKGGTTRDLVALHTDLKLLVLAHSPKHYTMLGRFVAGAGSRAQAGSHEYGRLLMEGLRLQATRSKNTNVLLHAMGYFKKRLTRDEKEELVEVIGSFHRGHVPLLVPMTLINHYARKFGEVYLKRQVYLNPYPVELMARNHV